MAYGINYQGTRALFSSYSHSSNYHGRLWRSESNESEWLLPMVPESVAYLGNDCISQLFERGLSISRKCPWLSGSLRDIRIARERRKESKRIRKEDSWDEVKRSHGLVGQYCCFQRRSTQTCLVRKRKNEWEKYDILYEWILGQNRTFSYMGSCFSRNSYTSFKGVSSLLTSSGLGLKGPNGTSNHPINARTKNIFGLHHAVVTKLKEPNCLGCFCLL